MAIRCSSHDVPLILDDVQMGCGRTGAFFSFEESGILPDIVCLSKSIGGYGLPLALTLIREDLDVWEPGEHTGTFRGVDPALVAGTAALRAYWSDVALKRSSLRRAPLIAATLETVCHDTPDESISVRGRGMVHGLAFGRAEQAAQVSAAAFELGLLVETCGPENDVVKLLPPLTIDDDELQEGVDLLVQAVLRTC